MPKKTEIKEQRPDDPDIQTDPVDPNAEHEDVDLSENGDFFSDLYGQVSGENGSS